MMPVLMPNQRSPPYLVFLFFFLSLVLLGTMSNSKCAVGDNTIVHSYFCVCCVVLVFVVCVVFVLVPW